MVSNTPEEGKIYRIPSQNVERLKRRMDSLSRRAKKLGCEEPRLVEMGFEDVPVLKPSTTHIGSWEPTGRVDRYFRYEVSGSAPSYGGWEFTASVDQMPEAGNLIRVVPGKILPEKYRTESKVTGKVVKVSDFGIFIQLEPGIEGLVHITQIPPGKKFTEGDEIDCYIQDMDTKTKKMSLGLVLTSKPVGYK